MDNRKERELNDEFIALTFRESAGYNSQASQQLPPLVSEGVAPIPWRQAFPELTDDLLPGLTLKGTRQLAGLTQQQLAKRLGMSRSQISVLENGKQSIHRDTAKQLAKVFKVSYRLFLVP
jgi:DNA-binding XRE family transcriptional regulator